METIYNFGQICQDVRELARAKTNLLNISPPEKAIRISTYDDLALQTFMRNIPSNIPTMIRIKNPQTIEQALAMVIEEENFLYSQNKSKHFNLFQSNSTQENCAWKQCIQNEYFKPNKQ